jgi:hypothetical protein
VTIDIAAVVNLHREGERAIPSIVSAWRAVERAETEGISCELWLVLDDADAKTLAMARRWKDRGAHILESAVGDLGSARNAATRAATAEWIAFLDADDLWGVDWLLLAHTAATNYRPDGARDGRSIDVWHPLVNVIFGDHHSLLHHLDSTDPRFRFSRFRLHNAWTSLSLARREDLLALPYPRNNLASGFGFEDWSWNEAVLRRGGRHHVVADTCHFIHRTDAPSLLGQSQKALRTRYPLTSAADLPMVDSEPLWPEVSSVPPDLDGTHVLAKVVLSDGILEQVRIAATITPSTAETVSPAGYPRELLQNFNTHVTNAQLALEQVSEELSSAPDEPLAVVLDRCELLVGLAESDRARVIAEVLLDEPPSGREIGRSELIDATIGIYPQLRP